MYFKALFRRYSTLKMGFQPTISDFLKFILLSAPNEIQIIEGRHLILRFCEQSMHTLNTIVNQPSNINFFDLLPLENCDFCKVWQIFGLFGNFDIQ